MNAALDPADAAGIACIESEDLALELLNTLVATLHTTEGAAEAKALADRLQDAVCNAFNAYTEAITMLEQQGAPTPATSASPADTPPAWQRDLMARAVRHMALNWHRPRAPFDFTVPDHELHGGRYRGTLACDPITAQLSLHVHRADSGTFACASQPVSLALIDPANWNRKLRFSLRC